MSGRAVAIIQARMTSTRLRGKVLLPLAGRPVLLHVIERARRIPGCDAVCIAIPDGEDQQPLVDLALAQPGAIVTRGPEADVLRRYAVAARSTAADLVVRITSDCPLIDPLVSGVVLEACRISGGAYTRTSMHSGYPLGLDTEAFSAELLFAADRQATQPADREHVTPFLWRQPEMFPAVHIDRRPDRRQWRLTLDEPADYTLMQSIFDALSPISPSFGMREMEPFLAARPDLLALNAHVAPTQRSELPHNISR